MQNFEQLGKELQRRGKTEALKKLAESREGQQLAAMIDPQQMEQAARSGDSAAIKALLSSVLSTREGRELAENVRRMMEN